MRGLMLVLVVAAAPVWAEDARLDGAAITSALSGQILAYADGSLQVFRPDSASVFDFRTQNLGQWAVRGGQYCAVWPPSVDWVCHDVTAGGDGRALTFIAADGSLRTGQFVRP